jgi:hypothetical protein
VAIGAPLANLKIGDGLLAGREAREFTISRLATFGDVKNRSARRPGVVTLPRAGARRPARQVDRSSAATDVTARLVVGSIARPIRR